MPDACLDRWAAGKVKMRSGAWTGLGMKIITLEKAQCLLPIFMAVSFVVAQETESADSAQHPGRDEEIEKIGESVDQFKDKVQQAIREKQEETSGDEKVMKEIETFVLEQSIREYEKRIHTVVQRKRDSLAVLAQKEAADSVVLAQRRRELDSLEQAFKDKKAEILSSPSAAEMPGPPREEPVAAPRESFSAEDIKSMRVTADTSQQVIVVGTQPTDEGPERKPDSAYANPFLQFLAQNFMSSTGTREQITTIELGMNFYLANEVKFYDYFISNMGFRFGFTFPFKTPVVVTYYRVRAMFHKAELSQADTTGKTYLTATNEILVGKNFFVRNQPFEYIPYGGFGFDNGIIVEKAVDAGFVGAEVHYFWFWMVGVMVKRHFNVKNYRFAVGGMLSYENAFVVDPEPSIDDEAMKRRLSISAIFSY